MQYLIATTIKNLRKATFKEEGFKKKHKIKPFSSKRIQQKRANQKAKTNHTIKCNRSWHTNQLHSAESDVNYLSMSSQI